MNWTEILKKEGFPHCPPYCCQIQTADEYTCGKAQKINIKQIDVMRDNDKVIKVAKITSAIFNPFVVPFLAFLVFIFCSYLSMLPLTYRLIVLGIVYAFTILLPMIAIFFFRKINGWGFGVFRARKVFCSLSVNHYLLCSVW